MLAGLGNSGAIKVKQVHMPLKELESILRLYCGRLAKGLIFQSFPRLGNARYIKKLLICVCLNQTRKDQSFVYNSIRLLGHRVIRVSFCTH